MKYTSKAFKHGQRMIVVSATVSGEATENMLTFAGESINTAAAGALDASAKRLIVANLSGDAKKKVLKGVTRDSYFNDFGTVANAMVGYKAPGNMTDVTITDAGAWVGVTDTSKAAEAALALLVSVGIPEADAIVKVQAVYPTFRKAAVVEAQPELPTQQPNEGVAE